MPPAVIPVLFLTFASLFAFSAAGIPQHISVPTRLPPSDTLITTNNFEITVHNTFYIYQNSNPQTTHDTTNSHSHLIRWCSFLTIAVNLALAGYLIHVGWGRYWCQTWEDQTGHVAQGCPVNRRLPGVRNGAVSAAPASVDDDSALPSVVRNTRDTPARASPERGRRSAAATASDNGTPQHNALLSQASSTEEPGGESHNHNHVTRHNGSGSSSSRTLSALVQASPPLPADDTSPAWTPSTASPVAKYAGHRPFRSGPIRAPSRRQRPTQHNVTSDVIGVRRRPFRSGPTRAPDNQQQPTQQNVTSDIFEPRWDGSIDSAPLLATLFTSNIYAWSTTNVFEPIPQHSTPLLATLYAGLSGPSVLSTTKWFILVVAVPTKFVHDPKFDLPFLRRVFESFKSPNVYFDWLFGKDATLGNIRLKLCSLYRAAQEADTPSHLLVHLTGMGDGPGGLWIFGGEVITDQEIGSCLADLRAEAIVSQPAMSVFLDVCREGIKQQSSVDYDLALVWSCSAGQQAYGVYLGKDLPSSFFVIALFSVCHDVCVESGSFEKAFTQAFTLRMNDLDEYLQFIYHEAHKSGTCKHCPNGGKCPQPRPQKPEWEHAGLKALVHLVKLIGTEYPDHAREVSNALAHKMIERGFLETRYDNSPTVRYICAEHGPHDSRQGGCDNERWLEIPALLLGIFILFLSLLSRLL